MVKIKRPNRKNKRMATIKAFTTIEQSRKLAEILPLETADMWWLYVTAQGKYIAMTYEEPDPHYLARMESYGIKDAAIRCWSLAALLKIMSYPTLSQEYDGKWSCREYQEGEEVEGYENPVDACVALVEKLHELNLL